MPFEYKLDRQDDLLALLAEQDSKIEILSDQIQDQDALNQELEKQHIQVYQLHTQSAIDKDRNEKRVSELQDSYKDKCAWFQERV